MAQSGQSLQEPGSPPPVPKDRRPTPSTSSVDPKNPGPWGRIPGRANGGPEDVDCEASEAEPEPEPDLDHPNGNHPNGRSQEHGPEKVSQEKALDPDDPRLFPVRKMNRQVVPGLPRAQTFRRQQSELRDNLMPAELTPAERRGLSADRRLQSPPLNDSSNPHSSTPDVSSLGDVFVDGGFSSTTVSINPVHTPALSINTTGDRPWDDDTPFSPEFAGRFFSEPPRAEVTTAPEPLPTSMDAGSMTTSVYDQLIHDDLERIWILNLSMHFRDKSKREKFFITYRQSEHLWRRVTISLDYRSSPENSLELDLEHTKFQREKNAKIYEAIRDSLADIQFYDTVTNLKLQTTDGRLHVHVVEDVNEIVNFPTPRMIHHLNCRRIKEHEIQFIAHMSGFVYKVQVDGLELIKKEIPGPDTVDEFLYEINALSQLQDSRNVIEFYGVVVDEEEKHIKGLLISYAKNGALVDMIYDGEQRLPWARREKWARQIVEGLSDIHESGFVQGDFTLSNIVIDSNDDAKIIDINRRGCPVGWEPPEATPLIESSQRISMYIGVKSDLYQLGMVLWAIAMQEDEPERHSRPLRIGAEVVDCPRWYRIIVDTCLSANPRNRLQALSLAAMFPRPDFAYGGQVQHYHQPYSHGPSASVDSSIHGSVHGSLHGSLHAYGGAPIIRTVNSPPPDWPYKTFVPNPTFLDAPPGVGQGPYHFPMRGRSPPSPQASHRGGATYSGRYGAPAWSAYSYEQGCSETSVSDVGGDDQETKFRPIGERSATPRNKLIGSITGTDNDDDQTMGASLIIPNDLALNTRLSPGGFDDLDDITPMAERRFTALDEGLPRFVTPVTGGDLYQKPRPRVHVIEPSEVPLPESPPGNETPAAVKASTEGGSEKNWEDGEMGGGARIWQGEAQAKDKEIGSTEPSSRDDSIDKSLAVHLAARREAAQSSRTATPFRKSGPDEISVVGSEADGVEGASVTPVAESPATVRLRVDTTTWVPVVRALSPYPSSARSSPPTALPDELTGVGSAHDENINEAIRAQGSSIYDDFFGNAAAARGSLGGHRQERPMTARITTPLT